MAGKAKPAVAAVKQAEAPAPVRPKPFAKPVIVDNPDPLHTALLREIIDPSSEEPLPQSSVVSVIDRVVNGIVKGEPIGECKDEVLRMLTHPTEKAQVMLGMLLNCDFERLGMFIKIRDRTEKMLERAVGRSDLTIAEALALNRTACVEISVIRAHLDAEQPTLDTQTLTEKIDAKKQVVERKIERTLQRSSPQGREIIRKRIYAMQKGDAASGPNGNVV